MYVDMKGEGVKVSFCVDVSRARLISMPNILHMAGASQAKVTTGRVNPNFVTVILNSSIKQDITYLLYINMQLLYVAAKRCTCSIWTKPYNSTFSSCTKNFDKNIVNKYHANSAFGIKEREGA